MHKCALGSERVTKMLVACCVLITYSQCYPERWFKTLNIVLEKGKVSALGKLRTTQLVEVDFQLLMRIFANEIMVGVIETDKRISKEN